MKDIPKNDPPLPTVGANHDLHERMTADAALNASEMRYRRLFEAAHDGILILNPDTRKIIDANPFMTQLLGYSHDQLIGMELYEIGFLADAQASQEMFQTLKNTRQVRYENLPLQARQGGLREVEVVANLYEENDHTVVQCNVRDITERRRAEKESLEHQNFLDGIFKVLPGVLYVFDMDENRVVFVNNTAALTFTPEEVAGMGTDMVRNLMHPDDQPRFQEHVAHMRTLNPGETAAFEYRMRDRADEWRWYLSTDAVYLRNENGVARQFIGIAQEITARKRLELSLQISEARHSLLIGSWAQAVWETDAHGFAITDSPSWRAFTGQTVQEWLGNGWFDAIHPDDRVYAEGQWREATAAHALVNAEFRVCAPDGGWRWTNVRAAPVLDAKGDVEKWVGMNIDIAKSKLAEKTLRDVEDRHRLVLETCHIGTYHGDLKRGEAYWNSVEFELLGLKEGDAPPVPETFYKYVHPDDVASLKATWDAGLEDKEQDTEFRVIRADGEERWMAVRGANYPEGQDEQGQLHQRYFGVNFDVTDRKLTELALRDNEARLSRILNQSPAGIVQADADGRIVLVNSRWCEMLGYSEAEMLGMNIIDVTHPSSVEPTLEALGRLAKGGPDFQIDKSYRRKDGAMLQVNSNVAALRDAQGNYLGLLAVVVDLSERLEADAKLRDGLQSMALAAEATGIGFWEWNVHTNVIRWDAQMFQLYGVPPTDDGCVSYETWRAAVLPEEFAEDDAILINTVQTHGQGAREFRIRRSDTGEWRTMQSVEAMRANNGAKSEWMVGTNVDITDRKRAEEHEQLLMAEVNHRAKNLLSVVQAVAQQTAKSGDPLTFAARLSDRIGGLAANQDLLVKNLWQGVGVSELVTSQLSHFKDLIDARVHLHGPELTVTAAASQTIGMAVHELATNAAKYGALSNANGQVHVEWQLTAGPDSQFLMSWRESDGPQVKPPTRKGFGQTVIKRLVETSVDGAVKVDYAEDGFSWHLGTAAGNVLVTSGGGIMNPNNDAR